MHKAVTDVLFLFLGGAAGTAAVICLAGLPWRTLTVRAIYTRAAGGPRGPSSHSTSACAQSRAR